MTTVDDTVAVGRLVRLRRKRLSDAEDDYRWRCDPELAKFDAASPLRSSFRDFLTTFHDDLRFPSPFRRTLSVDTADGLHIGNVMYYNIDERKGEAELGITIGDKRFWAKGYGTDTVRTFLHHLFTEANMRRIYLNTLEWNVRAQHAFKNAGFRECGVNRRGFNTFVTMEALRDWFPNGVLLDEDA